MNSKYDNIETARQLIEEVISNGLSIEQEDRNRAADIFGNSGIGELAELANSDKCISGKMVADMFYFIAFNVWNWRDAVNFYNEHTNVASRKLREVSKDLNEARKEIETQNNRVDELKAEVEENRNRYHDAETRSIVLKTDLEDAQNEILALKAKLYDKIVKEEKMKGCWIVLSPELAEKHYNELTGFDQKERFISGIVERGTKTRRDGMFEIGTREQGLTRKTKAEIIAYCEANDIPYTVEEFEYMNV